MTTIFGNVAEARRVRGTIRGRRCLRMLGAAVAFLVGCKAYEPRPLDLDATFEAWTRRAPDLVAFDAARADSRPTAIDTSDGIDADEAERIALVFNGDLRVARADVAVRTAVAAHAGVWDDPVLGVDFERVVSGADGIGPNVLRPTLGLTLPISGRLALLRAAADADTRTQLTRVAALEWDLGIRVRRAWFDRASAAARVELLRTAADSLDALGTVASRQAEAGVLSGLEARLFRLESAVLHADLADAVEAEREADVHLRDLMGLPPGPEPRFSSGGWPVAVGDDGDDWKRRSLEIALRSAEYEAAERRLELEIRRQYPDLGVGPGYGTDQGDRRFLFDVSIPIPLWNANAGAIAEAEAIREGARTRFEAECASVGSKVASARAAASAASRRRERIENSVIPLAEAQVTDVKRMADLGRVDAVLAMQAVKARVDAALRLIDARNAEAAAADTVRRWVGPRSVRPASNPTNTLIGEDRP